MEYSATAKYIRMSTRRLRFVADAIKMLPADRALGVLAQMAQHGATPIRDVLASAVSNAKTKGKDSSAVSIKSIEVMGGPVMKRWRAASRGQAHAYKKRMSHIKVILYDIHVNEIKNSQQGAK